MSKPGKSKNTNELQTFKNEMEHQRFLLQQQAETELKKRGKLKSKYDSIVSQQEKTRQQFREVSSKLTQQITARGGDIISELYRNPRYLKLSNKLEVLEKQRKGLLDQIAQIDRIVSIARRA